MKALTGKRASFEAFDGMVDFMLVPDSYGRSYFLQLLEERFPAIAAEIDDHERDLLHLEMAVFARATCREIDECRWDEVRSHLGFADELMSHAGSDLENALYVSYLENVFLGPQDARYDSARAMLSERLRTALEELEEHWRSIAAWKKSQK